MDVYDAKVFATSSRARSFILKSPNSKNVQWTCRKCNPRSFCLKKNYFFGPCRHLRTCSSRSFVIPVSVLDGQEVIKQKGGWAFDYLWWFCHENSAWERSVLRTSWFDFAKGLDPDVACQWDAKHKPLILADVCALPSALLVERMFPPGQVAMSALWSA